MKSQTYIITNPPWHLDNTRLTIMRQIGAATLLAVSGGRFQLPEPDRLRLPVACGYKVDVTYDAGSDLYEVARIWVRGDQTFVKDTLDGIYADQLSEVVWAASCFRNVPFGKHDPCK